MKRIVGMFLMATIAVTSLTGCYGKFALTKKIYQVNGGVQDKYLRSALTWVFIIVPVYGVAALADFIAFNTIEFWSGKNPVAAGEKNFRYVQDGERFDVHVSKQRDSVNYVIKHYRGEFFIDTCSISWDAKSGTSTAQLQQFGNTTEYRAALQNGGVMVQQAVNGILPRELKMVAFYK